MPDSKERHHSYTRMAYSWRQVRDCIDGSNAIKRGNEVYLPMPSGMRLLDSAVSLSRPSQGELHELATFNMPWYHRNPAYSAYLQRARFSDITASVVRGLMGVAKKGTAEIKAAPEIEELRSTTGEDIDGVYEKTVSELLKVGRVCYVLDVTESNEFALAFYSTERVVDWEYAVIEGFRVLVRVVLIEEFEKENGSEKSIEYRLENGVAVSQKYEDDKPVDEEILIHRQGKTVDRLPVFFAGSEDNDATPDIIPLMGVSDIAITAYRKDADLSHAQYMTCNPTLFIYGINEDQTPKMIGSTVTVALSNPQAKAEYPATDTSALNHVRESIAELFQEAINMSAQMLGAGKKSAESAEALAMREASSGATLLSIVENASDFVQEIMQFATLWMGRSDEAIYEASKDFADHSLTAQMLTALVSSWTQGAISHDTLLERIRGANIVDGDITNEEEKEKIAIEEEGRMDVILKTAEANKQDENQDPDIGEK